VKDVMVMYLVDNIIKDVGVHTYSFPVLIKVAIVLVFKEM